MNEENFYEKQYGEKKLVLQKMSFSILRKIFYKLDLTREDLALSMLENGEKLLDLGCGDGSFLLKCKSKFLELYGLDVSPSRIKIAEKRAEALANQNKFYFRASNLNERMPFLSDNNFDAVSCIATLEHLFDPYFVVQEIHRVLKKNGILVLEVPNIAYLKHRVRLLLGLLPRTSAALNWRQSGWDSGHLHYFTKKSLIELLEGSGFRVIKISGCGFLAKLRNWWPSLLTGDLCVKCIKK